LDDNWLISNNHAAVALSVVLSVQPKVMVVRVVSERSCLVSRRCLALLDLTLVLSVARLYWNCASQSIAWCLSR